MERPEVVPVGAGGAERASPAPPWRRALQWLLLAAAVGYLGYYLHDQWQALSDELLRLRPSALVTATLAIVAMLLLKSLYHLVVLHRLGHAGRPGRAAVVSAYALSQVVRYLPGKVFGVIFEANRLAPHVDAHRVVAANVIQSLYTMAFAVGMITVTSAWLLLDLPLLAMIGLAALVALGWIAHRRHHIERFIFWLAGRLPQLRRLSRLPETSSQWSMHASLLLIAEWAPYFLFWALILPRETELLRTAVLLGSSYAGAALAANLAVISPSGLFVREAIFLWMGSQLGVEPPTVMVLGIVVRLVLTLADLLFATLAWLTEAVVDRI